MMATSLNIIQSPSPNYSTRVLAAGAAIDHLIFHYTDLPSAAGAIALLQQAYPQDPKREVSAHYVVDTDGTIFQLVPDHLCAWHAGQSYWRGQTALNHRSIGIELVNPGHSWGLEAFSAAQIATCLNLSQYLVHHHAIPAYNIVGHSDVAPQRKLDPGPHFPWALFAKNGVGHWPQSAIKPEPLVALELIQRLLRQYGYDCPQTGVLDTQTETILRSFHAHFCPSTISAEPHALTYPILRELVDS